MCTHDVGNSAEIREITKNVKRFREISDDTERLHAPVERFMEISDDTERLHAPVKRFREISDDTERLHAPVLDTLEIYIDDFERFVGMSFCCCCGWRGQYVVGGRRTDIE